MQTNLRHRAFNELLGKKISSGKKNEKLKEREFLQLFVETSLIKLSLLPKKKHLISYIKNYLIELLVVLPLMNKGTSYLF